MNKYFLIVLIVFLNFQLAAQSKEVKRAEASFNEGNYPQALTQYQTLLEGEQDQTIRANYRYQIGEIYRRQNRPDRAEKWFNDAIKGGYMSSNAYMALGESQMKLGKYDAAKSSFESYKLANPSDPLGDVRLASCDFAKENQITISLFDLKRLDLNSRKSDFGVSYFNESLLFTTTRPLGNNNVSEPEEEEPVDKYADRVVPGKKSKEKSFTKSGLNETKIMMAVGSAGRFNRPVELTEMNKTKDFADDGIVIYDPYSHQALYTRRDGKKTFIHILGLKSNKWDKIGKIEVKSHGEPIGHPFITKEGDRIYFTSTMPGGFGKSDIWYIDKTSPTTWSDPVNAGDKINTPGNEIYPHIGGDYFFFASDGRIGLGGFDIFASNIVNGEMQVAINLGAPFNSSADDYNLNIRSDNKEGVLVSGRIPKNEDDIYHFMGFPSNVTATGRVTDANTKVAITNVALELFVDGRSLGKATSDEQGNFMIPIAPKTEYILKATVIGYNSAEKTFVSGKDLFGRVNKNSGIDLDFALSSNASVITGRIEDRRTGVPLEDEVVSLFANGKIVQTVKTDASGIYKFGNLTSNTKYSIVADPKNYFQDSRNIAVANANQKMEYSKRTGYDLNLALERFDVNKENVLQNVVFQSEKTTILTESYKELDRIADLFNKNPQTTIVVTVYVDLRTTTSIANELSNRRAREIRDYFVNVKKVNPKQLTASGAGKSRPIESNPKTEEEHRRNDRVTYKVTRVDLNLPKLTGTNEPSVGSNTTVTTKPGDSKPATSNTNTGSTVSSKPETKPNNTKPATSAVAPEELPFRVQIAGLKALNLKAPDFIKIKTKLGYDIRYELGVDGIYRYYVGGFATKQEAEDVAVKIKELAITAIVKSKP